MVNHLNSAAITVEVTAECGKIWQLCNSENLIHHKVKVLLEYLLHRPYLHLATPLADIAVGGLGEMLQKMATVHEAEISFTSFDCVTLVEIVFAVVHAMHYNREDKFQDLFVTNLLSLRYYRGVDTFILRNHMMEMDWLPNNTWLFKDITHSLSDTVLIASANVNKLAWLTNHKLLSGFGVDKATMTTLVADLLKANNLSFWLKQATLPYIPSTYFLANRQVISAKFPALAIVNIIRPGWDLTATIGTELNMSHLGITLKDEAGTLYFYNASSEYGMVICETMQTYLERYLNTPTIKGINVLAYDFE